MNPYQMNWNYGYTLGPSTDQNRGAYTQYYQQSSGQHAGQPGVNQQNLRDPAKPVPKPPTTPYPQQGVNQQFKKEPVSSAGGWAQVKGYHPPAPPLKAQVFVTASSATTIKSEPITNFKGEQFIGPTKPQAVVNPTQSQDDCGLALMKLHEIAITNKLVERYEKVEEAAKSGSPPSTAFKINLFIGNETYQGVGQSVKAAKSSAASQALANTKYPSASEKKGSMFLTAKRIGVTATSELHELATKKGVRVDFKFLEPFNFEFKHSMRMWSKKEMTGNYRVQLNVAGYEFYGQAELPQQAKHNAATQAMPIVRNLPDPTGTATAVIPAQLPPLTSSLANKPAVPSQAAVLAPSAQSAEPADINSLLSKNVNMALNEIAMTNGCVPEWTLVSETGPPHQKVFTWQLKLGEHMTLGTGPNKKLAKNTAADQMMLILPEQWKQAANKKIKKRSSGSNKRKSSSTGQSSQPPPKKKMEAEDDGKIVITADNPVSCLYEYAKKAKIPDPEFDCVAENLLETWQRGNQTFKKVEYTMQLVIAEKTYLAASNTKKAAKNATAAEAWNTIRATLL